MAIRTLTPADMANPTPILAAIPSGTADDRMTVVLPIGEFETDLVLEVVGKRFWSLIGGPTTLRFPTYGPRSNDGNYERRHTRFAEMPDFYIGGLKIRGPHKVRSIEDPTRAKYDSTKAFQHGFVFAYSQRVTVEDVEAYEVGGDGVYLNAVDDFYLNGLWVEFNGRQGFAGIDGNRWLFEKVNTVNPARNALDFEPIGRRPGTTEERWVSGVVIRDSDLRGGVTLHRVSDITFERNRIREGKFNVTGVNDRLAQRRYGIRILNNRWPDLWRSKSGDTGPIQFASINGAEVRGNYCHRDPNDSHTAQAPFVEMRAVPAQGHVVVQDNDLADFVTPFKWKDGLTPSPLVTTDIQGESPTVPTVIDFPFRQQISRYLTGTSITADLRVAPVEGNWIFAAVSAATTLANLTGPAGYLKAVERQGSGISVQLWYKQAGVNEPTAVTVTSAVSAALKIHVFETADLFTGLGGVASNDSGASAVTSLATGTATATQEVLAVSVVAALGGNPDYRLLSWDGFTALSDHETQGLAVGFGIFGAGSVGTTATWQQATAPLTMKAAGLTATFNLAAPLVIADPVLNRVAAGTRRAKLNLLATVTDTLSPFPVYAGHLYMAFVGASKTGGISGDCSLTHPGLNWGLVESHFIGAGRRVHLFSDTPTVDAAAGSAVITAPVVGVGLWWLILDVTTGQIVQVAVGDEPTGATFVEVSLPNPPSGPVIGMCLHGQPEPELVDDDPEVHFLYAAGKIEGQWASVQWGYDQTFRWDWASTIHALTVMVEVG